MPPPDTSGHCRGRRAAHRRRNLLTEQEFSSDRKFFAGRE